MNLREKKYADIGLVRDMLQTPDIIREFSPERVIEVAKGLRRNFSENFRSGSCSMDTQVSESLTKRESNSDIASAKQQLLSLLFVGEGSSRFFPVGNAMDWAARHGSSLRLASSGGWAAMERNLRNWIVFAISNSGRSSELVELFRHMGNAGRSDRWLLVSEDASPLEKISDGHVQLRSGQELAVAATKSVIEQALFCQCLVQVLSRVDLDFDEQTFSVSLCPEDQLGDQPEDQLEGQLEDQLKGQLRSQLESLATCFQSTLEQSIEADLVQRVADAKTIYIVGRSDGTAEELALKATEICRKSAISLPGTDVLHGIEETMTAQDIILWLDPIQSLEPRFQERFVERIGVSIIAISDLECRFPRIPVPKHEFASYLRLGAGWNLLLEVGLRLGINVDRPQRARKVGSEIF